MSLKQRWEEFKCMHYWERGVITDAIYGRGFEYEYRCLRCGKLIKRFEGHEPISESDHPRYDEKDPRYNLSPPIIRPKDE